MHEEGTTVEFFLAYVTCDDTTGGSDSVRPPHSVSHRKATFDGQMGWMCAFRVVSPHCLRSPSHTRLISAPLNGTSVHGGVLQARQVVAGRADVLRRGANFKHFVDGFPETVEIILYQT